MKFKPILFAFTVIFLSGCSNNDNSSSGSLNDTISDEKPTLLPYDIDKTGSINRFYANDENSENIVIPSTYSIDSDGRIITGNAYEIKTISEFCFANNSLIKTVGLLIIKMPTGTKTVFQIDKYGRVLMN